MNHWFAAEKISFLVLRRFFAALVAVQILSGTAAFALEPNEILIIANSDRSQSLSHNITVKNAMFRPTIFSPCLWGRPQVIQSVETIIISSLPTQFAANYPAEDLRVKSNVS